jgi:hypothetical protein
MRKIMYLAVLLGTVATIAIAVKPQATTAQGGITRGVPEQYVGSWVCQSIMPGYNLMLPNSPTMVTTPSTVIVQKFSLQGDGTYQTPSAKGHYSFDPASSAIAWLDGPHKEALTKTRLGKSKKGEASVDFIANKRYYGCFQPKPKS